MGWKEQLSRQRTVVLPWTGGRELRSWERSWRITGRLPAEEGWHAFSVHGLAARFLDRAEARPPDGALKGHVTGYLAGDRLVPDGARVDPDPARIAGATERVHLVEDGLDRFARVRAGRGFEGGPLIYDGQEMPLGPEDDVVRAFQDRLGSLDGIKGVTPPLEAAFRMECWQRSEAERRRAELERLRREAEERRAAEERLAAVRERLGDGAARREMARIDFGEAARAALAVGGAEYLDHRRAAVRGEMVVTFRLAARRFECVCEAGTLAIVDSGICLTGRSGVRGDERFTLESLPSVIREAVRDRVLVVYRHPDGEDGRGTFPDEEDEDL